MKTIYTSNYARRGGDPLAFGISASVPKWYEGRTINTVAPTWEIVRSIKNKEINKKQYTKLYFELLEQREFDAQQFIDNLPDGAYLLCYESPGDFCHRRLLAKWIQTFTGFIIEEWRNEQEQRQHEQQQFVDEMVKF